MDSSTRRDLGNLLNELDTAMLNWRAVWNKGLVEPTHYKHIHLIEWAAETDLIESLITNIKEYLNERTE